MVILHRWNDGRKQANTYTVNELIEALKQYPPETPVIGTWDDFGAPIDSIKMSPPKEYFQESVVVLDVSETHNIIFTKS